MHKSKHIDLSEKRPELLPVISINLQNTQAHKSPNIDIRRY